MSAADMADRYTILRIKRANGLDVEKELTEMKETIPLFDPNVLKSLQEANQQIWNAERGIGHLALISREWNGRRAKIKNKIAAEHNQPEDPKNYTI